MNATRIIFPRFHKLKEEFKLRSAFCDLAKDEGRLCDWKSYGLLPTELIKPEVEDVEQTDRHRPFLLRVAFLGELNGRAFWEQKAYESTNLS